MSPKFSKLDRLNIRKLQIGEKIAEYGIIAERMASGDVRWSINVMVDGRRIHRIVGRESEKTTRTQAEQLIEAAAYRSSRGPSAVTERSKATADTGKSCC